MRADYPAKGPRGESVPGQAALQDTVLLSEEARTPAPTAAATPQSEMGRPFASQAIAVLSKRYDILGEAGQGSMGSVYKARDRETGEIVALKLLKPEIASDQAMMDRFKNELLFARKITHKNVCRVHEFNRIGAIAYTSMEFVEGESLRSVLNRFGGLPVRKALDVAQQICSGLQEAHAQGIVHRDLKPENVMIDAQGSIKIMDFGIARSMEAGTRLTGSMVGTPAYMAPEQVSGRAVDYQTDVYSLGLVLYEIFTGTPAFQAENAVAVALKQTRESPTPPHEIEPTVPVAVERAVMKCLEKEPARRFQSVAELKRALKGSLSTPGQIQAAPTPNAAQPSRQRATVASHPLYGSSALLVAQPKRSSSATLWVMLIAVVAGAAYAGWGQPELRRVVVQLIERVKPAEPKPPILAPVPPTTSNEPADSVGYDPQPGASSLSQTNSPPEQHLATQSASAGTVTPTDQGAATVSGGPPSEGAATAAARKSPAGPEGRLTDRQTRPASSDDSASSRAPIAQKRASKPATDEDLPTIPVVADRVPSWVWVARYEGEDRAQDASRKISDLGLPVAVIPRRNLTGQVYLVVSGPFGPDRVTSVVDWLKTQGFLSVHPFTPTAVEKRQMSNQKAASQP